LKKIVVFAPHPDDETFGCGGTIMKRIEEGYDVVIAVMTDGRNALKDALGIDHDPTPEEVKHIRRKEVLKATQILGIPPGNLCFFGFEDGALHREVDEVVVKTTEILERYRPTEVYSSYAKDCHVDHKTTNQIVRRCVRKIHLSTSNYEYSIAQKHYPFNRVASILSNMLLGDLVIVDITEFLPRKEAAIKQYQSQISTISRRQGEPVIKPYHIKQFLRSKEIFFQLK